MRPQSPRKPLSKTGSMSHPPPMAPMLIQVGRRRPTAIPDERLLTLEERKRGAKRMPRWPACADGCARCCDHFAINPGETRGSFAEVVESMMLRANQLNLNSAAAT